MTSRLLYAVLAICGVVLACRIWGPLPFVHSPINAESVFAIAGLALLALKSSSMDEPMRTAGFSVPASIGLLAALLGIAFYRTANFFFLSDDFLLLKHAASAWQHPGAPFITAGGDGFYRPAGYLALGIISTWAGTEPLPWHLAGLLLHGANTILVLLLASKLGWARWGAWIAAAIFAVHGTRPEAVVWLAGRFDMFATFFVLAGLLAFLQSWHIAALALMMLGILSKESAYAFPLLLLLFERRRVRVLAPYFTVAAGLFAYRWWLFRGIGGYAGGLSLLAALKALALRIWAVLFFPIDWAWPAGPVLAVMMAVYLAALAWLFATARTPRHRVIVSLGFIAIAALPPLQQLSIGPDMQKSRVLYLPSVGFCLLMATAIESLTPRTRMGITAAVIAFQFTALWHNSSAWEYASRTAREVCENAAAVNSNPTVPASLNGVYFFANGFPECVELEKAKLK